MSRVGQPGLNIFCPIYWTNEEGYDQSDHIWASQPIVPYYDGIPDKISPSATRTLAPPYQMIGQII